MSTSRHADASVQIFLEKLALYEDKRSSLRAMKI